MSEHRWRIPVGAVLVHICIGSVYAWSTFNRPIQALLADAGIESEVTPDDDSDSLKILVPEDAVESAQDVIELAPADEETTPQD